MTDKNNIARKKCRTPKFRVSYPSVFEPTGFQNQPPKFSVTMLIPKSSAKATVDKDPVLQELRRVIETAKKEKWPTHVPKDFS